MKATPIGNTLGAAIEGLDLSKPLSDEEFDFAYKSNTRNILIYREALRGERRVSMDWAFIGFVALVLLVIFLLPLLGLFYLARYLGRF